MSDLTDAFLPAARTAMATVEDPDDTRRHVLDVARSWADGMPVQVARQHVTGPELFVAMGTSLGATQRDDKLLLIRFAEALEALRQGTADETYDTDFGTFTRRELERVGARFDVERDEAGRPVPHPETGIPRQVIFLPIRGGEKSARIYVDYRDGYDPVARRNARWSIANRRDEAPAETSNDRWNRTMERQP